MKSTLLRKKFSSYNNFNFFNRTEEVKNILNILSQRPTLNIVSGGNDTGKSMLLCNTFYEKISDKRFNLIHINFRNYPCNSVNDFARAILKNTPKTYFEKMIEKLPLERVKKIKIPMFLDVDLVPKNHEYSFSDLSEMFSSIEQVAPLYNNSGDFINTIFIDEVNELNNLYKTESGKLAAEYFFKWITMFTKETPKFHVFLGTSDSFFLHEIEKSMKSRCSFITIGDLLYDEALLYFEESIKILDQEQLKNLRKINFKKDIFEYVGGRIYHIDNAIRNYIINGEKCLDSDIFRSAQTSYYDALKFDKGKTGIVGFKGIIGWKNENLKKIMRAISDYGFIRYKDEKFDLEELLSLVNCNLLNYRQKAPIKEDIIGISKLDYPAFVSPSPIHHKAIKCIVEKDFKF